MTKPAKKLTPGAELVISQLPQYAREAAPRVLEHPHVLVVSPQLAALAKKFRSKPQEFMEMIVSGYFNRLGLSQMVGGPSVDEEIKRAVARWKARQCRKAKP